MPSEKLALTILFSFVTENKERKDEDERISPLGCKVMLGKPLVQIKPVSSWDLWEGLFLVLNISFL